VKGVRIARDLVKLAVHVENVTPVADPRMPRAAALCRSLVSTHVLLGADNGRFVSLLEPPDELADAVKTLKNDGLWPVLVGKRGADDVMLASPIILYDHPRVAPESAGDLFDATEIDELLTLRILTLSDDERFEVLRADPKGKALLERTEALDEATLASLHGAWRERGGDGDQRDETTKLDRGDRVVVRPRPNGDVLDIALAGETATVAIVEQDLEGRLFFGVTIDRDPGRDLGASGQPGHRFFFEREELEKIP
jgi:hydrogenase maturation protease